MTNKLYPHFKISNAFSKSTFTFRFILADKSVSTLPQSTVLANMTGHALWQTFVNEETTKDSTAGKKPTKEGTGGPYNRLLQVRSKGFINLNRVGTLNTVM